MITINEFATENLFNSIRYKDDVGDWHIVLWRETVEPNEGYIMVWPETGDSHHTYHYPPNIFENYS